MAKKLEAADREKGIIGETEYLEEEEFLLRKKNKKDKGGKEDVAV